MMHFTCYTRYEGKYTSFTACGRTVMNIGWLHNVTTNKELFLQNNVKNSFNNPDSSAACPECTKALGKSYEINNYIKNIVNENKQ